ncbi:MAG: hypothetical protein KY468_01000 [Armatimonadetes bacterium]|nr:hypothetical protein [Armatimonadota bacterium]
MPIPLLEIHFKSTALEQVEEAVRNEWSVRGLDMRLHLYPGGIGQNPWV